MSYLISLRQGDEKHFSRKSRVCDRLNAQTSLRHTHSLAFFLSHTCTHTQTHAVTHSWGSIGWWMRDACWFGAKHDISFPQGQPIRTTCQGKTAKALKAGQKKTHFNTHTQKQAHTNRHRNLVLYCCVHQNSLRASIHPDKETLQRLHDPNATEMFYSIIRSELIVFTRRNISSSMPSAVPACTKPNLVVNVLRVAPVPLGGGTVGWKLGGMGHRK